MQAEKHEQINSGLINICVKIFKNNKIIIFCDQKHKVRLVNNIQNTKNLLFRTFKYNGEKETKKAYIFYKTLRESILAFKLFKFAKRNKARLIIFASAFPFTALILNIYSYLFNQKIIIGLHGEIGILKLNKLSIITFIYKCSVKYFFKFRTKKVVLLIFGITIKNELFKLFPKYYQKNIITIDHPYNFNKSYQSFKNFKKYKNIVIANIGTGLITKNSHLIYELGEMQKYNIQNKLIKLLQIGNVSKETLKYSNEYVEIVNNNKFMPLEYFDEKVSLAHYFIYFFKKNSVYDLCPSGTFFDSIKYKKPIISLKNPFFEYYFERFGNIGYLCEDLIEMNNVLNNINNPYLYKIQVNNLILAEKQLSIENISNSFNIQINNLNL